jgi:spore maturation protein CgeB
MNYVFLGLSMTSAWGNGHATTYRALIRELTRRGHQVTFLERDVPWYRDNRDLPSPPYGSTLLYQNLPELYAQHGELVRTADVVVVGSYLPQGKEVIAWVQRSARGVTAFYDIDTPITLAALERDGCEYLAAAQVPAFDLYLSFSGGPSLGRLEDRFGAQRARPLYCSVDRELYYPAPQRERWLLGYLGTYSSDRQPVLDELLLGPACTLRGDAFVVAGPQYPSEMAWPQNVQRIDHVPPHEHRAFYNQQRFTLNITRAEMMRAGYSPSVRLFEAAACGVAIISDVWPGVETFFAPDELLLARGASDVRRFLTELSPEEAREIGARARTRILRQHTAAHRALELDEHVAEVLRDRGAASSRRHRSAAGGQA